MGGLKPRDPSAGACILYERIRVALAAQRDTLEPAESRQRNEAASLCHMPRNEAAHSEIKAGSDLALGRGRCLHMGWAEAGFEGTGQLTHHGAALDQQIGLVEE
jgi:deoxycytidine triphosphate deaminase